MINEEAETQRALNELVDEARKDDHRLLFWVGAGASAWCGYPLWNTLADQFHTAFLRYESC
jgi:fructoselysine-6-P-deglycase FrlB-like protein